MDFLPLIKYALWLIQTTVEFVCIYAMNTYTLSLWLFMLHMPLFSMKYVRNVCQIIDQKCKHEIGEEKFQTFRLKITEHFLAQIERRKSAEN